MPLEGEIESLCHRSIGRMPGDRNLLSLDASLAIPTRVLPFEVSGLRRAHWSDRCSSPVRPTGQTSLELLHLRLRLCGSTKEPSGFLVNHQKPRELGVDSGNRQS
jgi:hypothetical protein